MIRAFLNRLKEKQAIRLWKASTIGKALAAHTQEYFTQYPRLANLTTETKDKIVRDFYNAVGGLSLAENPFLAMRELLASYVIEYTGYQVLCLTEEEKRNAYYSDSPYISGVLYRHIDKMVEHHGGLREFKWKHPDLSSDELISFCNSRCLVLLYYLNGFNCVRIEFDDLDNDKDWLRPFITSMLIWEEDQVRSMLGLGSLLPGPMDALNHSIFVNMVVAGHRNPYFEWEKSMGNG
jgi:hypothetical protein